MKVEDIFFIQCVTGVKKNHGNGLGLLPTLGELQATYQITGNHLQAY
jgi:hypothetical protein